MVAESAEVAQVEDPMESLGAEDSAVQTSAGEPSVVEFEAALVTVEATTEIIVSELLATTSVSDEPIVGITPTQVELTPVSRPTLERESGNASAGLSHATDIME